MVIRVARLEDTPAMGRVMVDTYLSAHRGQVHEEAWEQRRAEWTPEVSAAAWARSLREIANGTNPRECLYVAEEPVASAAGGGGALWRERQRGGTHAQRGSSPGAVPRAGGQIVGIAMGGPAGAETLQNLRESVGDPEKTGAVYALYVRQSHQRRGLGRRLVQAVVADLLQKGISSLTIACLETNAPARGFYEALGGRVVGELEGEEYGFTYREVIYGWTDARTLL